MNIGIIAEWKGVRGNSQSKMVGPKRTCKPQSMVHAVVVMLHMTWAIRERTSFVRSDDDEYAKVCKKWFPSGKMKDKCFKKKGKKTRQDLGIWGNERKGEKNVQFFFSFFASPKIYQINFGCYLYRYWCVCSQTKGMKDRHRKKQTGWICLEQWKGEYFPQSVLRMCRWLMKRLFQRQQ